MSDDQDKELLPGFYELLESKAVEEKLKASRLAKSERKLALCTNDFVDELLAQSLKIAFKKALSALSPDGSESLKSAKGKVALQSKLNCYNQVLSAISAEASQESMSVEEPKLLVQLLELNNRLSAPSLKEDDSPLPHSTLSRSFLFTGLGGSPRLFKELNLEIRTADRIDLLVSFIKDGGVELILDELRAFTRRGGRLRIITTTYMGATEFKALENLASLDNTEIKISFDDKNTRLHAKAYIFHRKSGFSTAYVGSSNLSHPALDGGLEWNLKVTYREMPELFEHLSSTFDELFVRPDLIFFNAQDQELKARISSALKHKIFALKASSDSFEFFKPFDYQKEILDRLEYLREECGQNHNLVIAATGTGKTALCAFDYQNFTRKWRREHQKKDLYPPLLFVAHRKELLDQAKKTFQLVLKEPRFGEDDYNLGLNRAYFLSVQLINSRNVCTAFAPDYFAYICVDEFHHAAADSYQPILEHFKPQILLGLTATPERMDGKDVSSWFNYQYAAVIRLPEAIDRGLLTPFRYFLLHDNVDLDKTAFTKGDYDKNALENVYTQGQQAKERALLIDRAIRDYAPALQELKALGFCATVAHAEFMAKCFKEMGYKAEALSAQSAQQFRDDCAAALREGRLQILFVVDLYNEGVDIKELNTVLFLRPTQSLTIFLQQLGRGLRKIEGKRYLTVLDFVGQAHEKYSFTSRFAALLRHQRLGAGRILQQMQQGFTDLPLNCEITFEEQPQQVILKSLSAAVKDSAHQQIIDLIADYLEEHKEDPSLLDLKNLGVDPAQFYSAKTKSQRITFQELLLKAQELSDKTAHAKLSELKQFYQDHSVLRDFLARFSTTYAPSVNDFIEAIFSGALSDFSKLSGNERTLFKMLYRLFVPTTANKVKTAEAQEFDEIMGYFQNQKFKDDVSQIISFKKESQNFAVKSFAKETFGLLNRFGTYTRNEILLALGMSEERVSNAGVEYLEDINTDVFFITLNKDDKFFTDKTSYKDHLIDEQHFQWQSQYKTSAQSKPARRYIEGRSDILLCVRHQKGDNYTLFGLGKAIDSRDSNPVTITFRLDEPLPQSLVSEFKDF